MTPHFVFPACLFSLLLLSGCSKIPGYLSEPDNRSAAIIADQSSSQQNTGPESGARTPDNPAASSLEPEPRPSDIAQPAVPGTIQENTPGETLSVPVPLSDGVVLQYHHVDTTTPAITSITPDLFIQHLDYLDKHGYTVLPLEELVHGIRGRSEPPTRAIAITFDDAYTSIYETAFPELRSRGWPFTIFVATGFIGQSGYLDWDQIKEMQKHGALIANHTHSHLHMLRRLTDTESEQDWLMRNRQEILLAERLIQRNTGSAEKYFAYPYGEYAASLVQLLDSLGYISFGQQSGAIGESLDSGFLPRFPMAGIYASINTFPDKVASLPYPAPADYQEPLISEDNLRPLITLPVIDAGQSLNCFGPNGDMEIQEDQGLYQIRSSGDLPVGRSRYNCTMLAQPGRFYWYSQMWIRKKPDGSWYQER